MKGSKKVKIANKEVELKFDLGALCDFTEKLDIGLDEIDKALNKPTNLLIFIECLSHGSVTKDEVRSLEFAQLNDVFELVQSASGNLNAPKGAKK